MKNLGKRITSLTMALVLSAGLCAGGAFASEDDCVDVTVSASTRQSTARECLDSINAFRNDPDNQWYWNSDNTTKTQTGDLTDLVYDYDLEEIALQRALELLVKYDHTRPNGTSRTTAFTEYGYTGSSAENIGYGTSNFFVTAANVVDMFAETNENYAGQGHRRIMLSDNYTNVGVACVTLNGYNYWVMEFAKPTGETSTDTDPVGTDGYASKTVSVPSDLIASIDYTQNITVHEDRNTILSVYANVTSDTQTAPLNCAIAVDWSSSDENVATVSEAGLVEAVAPGTAVITGTCSAGTATYNVTVQEHEWVVDFVWNDDKDEPTAEVSFVCEGCDEFYGPYESTVIRDEDADEPATCEHDELVGYIAYFVYGDDQDDYVMDTHQVAVPDTILAHEYGEPEFVWADDYSACEAVFTCEICGYSVTETCEVAETETEYVATVEFNGETYEDAVAKETTTAATNKDEPTNDGNTDNGTDTNENTNTDETTQTGNSTTTDTSTVDNGGKSTGTTEVESPKTGDLDIAGLIAGIAVASLSGCGLAVICTKKKEEN